jgi:hypothetical protein
MLDYGLPTIPFIPILWTKVMVVRYRKHIRGWALIPGRTMQGHCLILHLAGVWKLAFGKARHDTLE